MMCTGPHTGRRLPPGNVHQQQFFMRRSTWIGALRLSALGAMVLTSGCTYVKGLYGGKAAPAPAVTTATTPVLYAPQRQYAADISAARAYVGTQLPVSQRMALIDVRDATEYRLGHPEGARHLPFPRVYQPCQPHPSGAPEAQIRSDDGSQCRYGAVAGAEVRQSAQAFWQAAQTALPYKDAPVAVLCRTGACAVDAANVLARPDLWVDKALQGQGYQAVYVIQEGFVGEPMAARDSASGQLLSTDPKGRQWHSGSTQPALYSVQPVPWDVNQDGKITPADYSGWRYFLGLPYVLSMPHSLRSDVAEPFYDKP